MHPLLVVAIILGALALLITLILSIPLVIHITAQTQQPLSLRYRLGPVPLKERAPEQPRGAVSRLLRKILGLSPLNDIKTAQRTVYRRGVGATLRQLADALKTLLAAILALLPHARVTRLRLHAVCAGEDAADIAMDYGIACAVVYPLIGYLETVFRRFPKEPEVQILCDFDAPQGAYELDAEIRVSLFQIFRAAFRLIRENMENEVYQSSEPSAKEEQNGI